MTRAAMFILTVALAGPPFAGAQPPPPPPPPPVPEGAIGVSIEMRGVTGGIAQPPRDAVPRPAVGTGRISGRVVAADSGAPLRRAQVRLNGAGLGQGQAISTDAEGNFTFANLPAGTFSLSAQKTNFLSMQYGQKRIGVGPGKSLKLADGQTLDKIEFALPRAGVISGRVVDDVGEPVPSAMVQAVKPRADGIVSMTMSASTDDLGQFRLHGLQPGEYIVSVMPRNVMMGGDVLDRTGYAQTYYPNTPNAADAQRINVQAGTETPNVAITLMLTTLAKVSGYVADARGGKLPQNGGSVQLRPANSNMPFFGGMGSGVRPDGSFVINNVAPGAYNVEARMGGPEQLFARAPVVVNGEDIANVMLIVSQGATARGKFVFEGGEAPIYRQGVVSINAVPLAPNEVSMMPNGPAKVAEDWTFEIKGLFGKRMLRAGGGNWVVKSITYRGTDVTDSAIEFKGNEVVDGFEVHLTNAVSSIDAAVTDPSGQPATDCVVLVFSTNRDKWTYQSRFVRTGFANAEGHALMSNVPPGDYYAVAVEPMEGGAERSPDVLEKLSRGADRLTLVEGEKKPIVLRYSPQ